MMARIVAAFAVTLLSLSEGNPAPNDVRQCAFQSQPGIEYLGSGVDLTNFVPRIGAIQSLKLHAVELTCNQGHKWVNPYTNNSYAIWDQIESILGDPSSARQGAFFKFSNTFDFSEHFEESVSSGGLFGLFSASEEFSESFSLATQVNASLKYEHGKVNGFVAMLSSDVKPSDEYLRAVADFPLFWWLPTSWPQVSTFMEQFGTHYIWKVVLGGEYRYFSACEATYLQAVGDAHADAQASLDFLFLLSADGGASGSASATETAYQAACMRKIGCIGGDQASCNMNSTDAWAKYVQSVDTTPGPGLTNAYYLLNADLLKTWHPIKHPVVRHATIVYIAWTGLEKLAEFYTATRALLMKIANMPMPSCYVSSLTEIKTFFGSGAKKPVCGTMPYVGKSADFKTSSCAQFGPTGNPQTAVANAKAWAAHILKATALHSGEMTAALNARSESYDITPWIAKTKDWLASFAVMTEKAYSFPTPYTCIATWDSVPEFCCSLCCYSAGQACGGARSDASSANFMEGESQTCNINSDNGNSDVGDSCSKRCNVGAPCTGSAVLPSGMTGALPPTFSSTPPAEIMI